MSEPVDIDPLDVLRRIDPVDPDQLPSASLARVGARIQEAIMQDTPHTRWRSRLRGRLLPASAGLAVASIALLVIVGGKTPTPVIAPGSSSGAPIAIVGGSTPTPVITPGSSSGVGSASCVEQYSPATLAKRAFAFDGTVTAIDGDMVTFAVTQRYRGTPASNVTLTATGMTGSAITSAGGPTLTLGGRYLVAGDDRFVWSCGFTQPYEANVAATWAQATAR